MPIALLLDALPEYAADLKANLNAVLSQPELSAQQTWGTAVSCALAAKSPRVAQIVGAEAAQHMSERAVTAAKTAGALMSMTNMFYRFRHLSGNPRYEQLPAKLRMAGLRVHGADPLDFDLWCLAVSALNACEACVRGHERALIEGGIAEEKIIAAVRIASVIYAVAAVVESEAPTRE